jgi:hypothetical protein
MAELRCRSEEPALRLRREVIVPQARDAATFHRTIALLSVFIAVLAGLVDTMLWRHARARAVAAEVVMRASEAPLHLVLRSAANGCDCDDPLCGL